MPPPELDTYRSRRDPRRTREPVPAPGPLPQGADDVFVVQEHHASALHWDFRLERGGVLASWAVPKGMPLDPGDNHLAVQTEDHPIDYADFAGEIAEGEYGAGEVRLWDRGRYVAEKWTADEVKVVLEGGRVRGRYVLFRTKGENWMLHRMDPPPEGWQPLPEPLTPMLAKPGELPADDAGWAYEFKWDGVRALVAVSGGRPRAWSRNRNDITAGYPELRGLAESLGSTEVLLDGELVAFDATGRPSFGALQQRMHVTKPADVRRLAARVPVTFLAFDLLHLDGRSTLELPYRDRRELLERLHLEGPSWATPPSFPGSGRAVLAASVEQGLEGVVAKRVDAAYQPGQRSGAWVKVKHERHQSVVVGGWQPGEGRRSGGIGALLLGVPDRHGAAGGLAYVGKVGTGFTDAVLADLGRRLRPLARDAPPFADAVPRPHARNARWVEPRLVGEVAFAEWTTDGRLRHPVWRGLREDLDPKDVVRE